MELVYRFYSKLTFITLNPKSLFSKTPNKSLKNINYMGKPKDPRFKDKDTEDFYHGEKVLKFQELSRSDKQDAHRKVVLIYQAKN